MLILKWSVQEVEPLPELEEINEKQCKLDESLSRFYSEAKNRKDEEYSRSS